MASEKLTGDRSKGFRDENGEMRIWPQYAVEKNSEYDDVVNAAKTDTPLSKRRSDEIQHNIDTRQKGVNATTKNKNLQAKLARKPAPPEEKKVGDPAEQDSLLVSGLKRMQTTSDAVKTKANKATEDKIHGIVSSRKTISSTASGATQSNKKSAVKQISGKQAPYK